MYAPQIIFLPPPPIHADLRGLYYKTAKKEGTQQKRSRRHIVFSKTVTTS